MNQPTIIKQILKMRIDMLGFSFIPQHSDARVSDQLIYKWNHFKKILHPILLEYYQDLLDKNFPISENILQRDIDNLLSGNAKNYLRNYVTNFKRLLKLVSIEIKGSP